MKEVLQRLNRLQHARAFKIAATALILTLALVGIGSYVLVRTGPSSAASAEAAAAVESSESGTPAGASDAGGAPEPVQSQFERSLRTVFAARTSTGDVVYGVTLLAGVAVVVVWLGLGLTYFGLLLLAAGIAAPLSQIPETEVYARMLVGVVALTATFTALMQGLRILLSPANPVFAVARNVLAEAVRMKISLVFIVMLVFGLAALPAVLDPDTPLRYRVQSFLQYGAGGSFWLIALLTLFFSVASVTGEQREKIIWQTVTKPVAAWQYILGKWLGVSLLSAALLLVSASGVFLFVEYLRSQPALGERVAYESRGDGMPSADRLILETQVLSARREFQPEPPFDRDDPDFIRAARERIERQTQADPNFVPDTPREMERVIDELFRAESLEQRSVAPGAIRTFVFEGLGSARDTDRLVLFRFKVDSGANNPDVTFTLNFRFNDAIYPQQRVGLGHPHTVELLPDVINDEGVLEVTVFNGALFVGPDGLIGERPNPASITFPEGTLVVSVAESSYQANFLRAVGVLWLKLAILAIWASTFLSFPVACLVAVGVFLTAESAMFLTTAVDRFGTTDRLGNPEYWRVPIYFVGSAVSWVFRIYADLRPVTRLVDGELLTFGHVLRGVAVLSAWIAVLFGAAVLTFRRRELATYSGH